MRRAEQQAPRKRAEAPRRVPEVLRIGSLGRAALGTSGGRAPGVHSGAEGAERMRRVVPARLALHGVAFVLTACGAIPVESPRTIAQLDTTFVASLPAPDSVSREQAIEAVRDKGVLIARPPDYAEFGTATCIEARPCLGDGKTARAVWLIEWETTTGPQSGIFFVDGDSGEVLAGFGNP